MDTKKLRQKILDLAIHGKLVPQDPNDEPASVLLERIKAEKERLIKEGKIKRTKKSAEASDMPHYGNVPFEVPDNWTWCKIKDIGSVVTGNTPSKDNADYYGGNIPFFKPTDLEQGRDTKYASDYLSALGFEQSQKLPAKTILVTCIGATIGKTGISSVAGSCNQQINAIIPNYGAFYIFVYYVCVSNYMQCEIKKNASATTLPILNKSNFENILFPLPPLVEQQRIVAEIERWFALIDVIEQNKSGLQTVIKQTKSKILDLAIHGKLVPQDPNDESASELLKRINPEAEVTCDNGHSKKLPNGWTNCRLCDVLQITMGQSPKGDSINKNKGIEFHQGKLCFTNKYLQSSNTFTTEPTKLAEANSILLCVRAPVGIVNITPRKICIGRGLCSLKPRKGNIDFYFYLLQTLKESFEKQATGTTFKAISGDIVKNEIIILPPFLEQQRIVAKIEELFSVLNNIQNALEA